MRGRGLSASALLGIALLSASAFGVSGAQVVFKLGDQWIYDMSMTIGEITMEGSVTYSYDGESTETVAGHNYSTYEMKYHGSMDISGFMSGYQTTGTATILGVDSMDTTNLDSIVSDYNLSMTAMTLYQGTPMTLVRWVHDVTKYSPPGGLGDVPEDPHVGESWTKIRTMYSNTMTSDNGVITEDSYARVVNETYTYLGVKTISVPAGTFKCEVIQANDGTNLETQWYSDEVGMLVKDVYEAGPSESGTQLLTSFRYTSPPSGISQSDTLMIASGVAGAAVAAVIIAWAFTRRGSPPKGQPSGPFPQEPGPPPPLFG